MITDREGLAKWMFFGYESMFNCGWDKLPEESKDYFYNKADALISECPGIFSDRLEADAVIEEINKADEEWGSIARLSKDYIEFVAGFICSRFSLDRAKFIEREKVLEWIMEELACKIDICGTCGDKEKHKSLLLLKSFIESEAGDGKRS